MRLKVVLPSLVVIVLVIVISLMVLSSAMESLSGFHRTTFQTSSGPFVLDGLDAEKCVSVVYQRDNSTLSGYVVIFQNQSAAQRFMSNYISQINESNVTEIQLLGNIVKLYTFPNGGYTIVSVRGNAFIVAASYRVDLSTLKEFYDLLVNRYVS